MTRPEQEIDFVEYLRLWASPDANDQAVRDLHKAADEIERLREEVAYLKQGWYPTPATVEAYPWWKQQEVRGE